MENWLVLQTCQYSIEGVTKMLNSQHFYVENWSSCINSVFYKYEIETT